MPHERTITVGKGGKWFNIPTVIKGQVLTPREAESKFNRGEIKAIGGSFDSLDAAVSAARKRSESFGTGGAPPLKSVK